MIPIDITPFDVALFVIPLFMAFFFYARAAKAETDSQQLALISFCISSVLIWFWGIYRISYPLLELFLYRN